MSLHAITRAPSPNLTACELTHLEREPIDAVRAAGEHEAYETALAELGCTLERLPAEPGLPDSVFVEDTALVLPEMAVIARPGAASRRPETESVAAVLRRYREVHRIEPPGILDGGDVLRLDHDLYVGLTSRSNAAAVEQLQQILEPLGYRVRGVNVSGCLHLKTAVSRLADDTVVLNPEWIDPDLFAGMRIIHVHPDEPAGGNVLCVGDTLLCAAAHEQTRQRLEAAGFRVRSVDITELAKAEAGMTCSSLIFDID